MLKLLFIVNLYKEKTVYVIGGGAERRSNRTIKNSGNFFYYNYSYSNNIFY